MNVWDTMVTVIAHIGFFVAAALATFGIAKLVFIPIAILADLSTTYRLRAANVRPRHARTRWNRLDQHPLVSVIVPAFNEAPVLANCIRSVLTGTYQRLEIVIVDDGSTDDTASIATSLAATDQRVRVLSQANAGKGAALNRGITEARGSVLMFVDADGIFSHDTVEQMLRAFDDPTIGAVCGDDRPVNLNRVQTHLLAILAHAGTGLVRRALHLMGCLPIVSGNLGAFPADVISSVGAFDKTTVGEDLELTWRIHRAGYRVVFAPRALVYAESPSTIAALWRQRVRWARGLLQTMRIHWRMIGNPRYGAFGAYLVVNTATMVVAPVLELVVLACLPFMIVAGVTPFSTSAWGLLAWIGLWVSVIVVVVSVVLNRALSDLRYAWTLLLWPIYCTGMAVVMAAALIQQARGRAAPWNKAIRTGIVTATGTRNQASSPGDGPQETPSAKIDAPPTRSRYTTARPLLSRYLPALVFAILAALTLVCAEWTLSRSLSDLQPVACGMTSSHQHHLYQTRPLVSA